MDASEFKQTLKDVGHGDLPEEQVQKMLDDVDRNQDHVISFPEFLAVSLASYSLILILVLDVQNFEV